MYKQLLLAFVNKLRILVLNNKQAMFYWYNRRLLLIIKKMLGLSCSKSGSDSCTLHCSSWKQHKLRRSYPSHLNVILIFKEVLSNESLQEVSSIWKNDSITKTKTQRHTIWMRKQKHINISIWMLYYNRIYYCIPYQKVTVFHEKW